TGIAIILLDIEGNVTTWNVGAERIFGYTAEEITGQHFSRFFVPEDVANEKPMRELEQARANVVATDDNWLVRRDGTRFWRSGVRSALRHASGAIRGFSKVVRDITEKKRTEESLRDTDRRKRIYRYACARIAKPPCSPRQLLGDTAPVKPRSRNHRSRPWDDGAAGRKAEAPGGGYP